MLSKTSRVLFRACIIIYQQKNYSPLFLIEIIVTSNYNGNAITEYTLHRFRLPPNNILKLRRVIYENNSEHYVRLSDNEFSKMDLKSLTQTAAVQRKTLFSRTGSRQFYEIKSNCSRANVVPALSFSIISLSARHVISSISIKCTIGKRTRQGGQYNNDEITTYTFKLCSFNISVTSQFILSSIISNFVFTRNFRRDIIL